MIRKKEIFAAIILILVMGCITPTRAPGIPTTENPQITSPKKDALISAYMREKNTTDKDAQAFFEKTYGIQGEKDLFKKLPNKPSTFEKDRNLLYAGNGNILNQIPEASYVQPEFYPTFESTGIPLWVGGQSVGASVVGVMATPGDQNAVVGETPSEFETTIFVGSVWGTTYYQGISLDASSDSPTPIPIQIEPHTLVIGPTFPTFSPEWVKKVTVRGTIPPLPGGDYTIMINAHEVPYEQAVIWDTQYSPFVNGAGFAMPSDGLITLRIHVP